MLIFNALINWAGRGYDCLIDALIDVNERTALARDTSQKEEGMQSFC